MNIPDLVSFITKPNASNTALKSAVTTVSASGDSPDSTTGTTETTAPTDTSSTTETPFTGATQSGEEFDTFLRLLTAQIENQDPLAPLDSTQFVEQLATFSGLELQAVANQRLEDISRLLAQQAFNNDATNGASNNSGTTETV